MSTSLPHDCLAVIATFLDSREELLTLAQTGRAGRDAVLDRLRFEGDPAACSCPSKVLRAYITGHDPAPLVALKSLGLWSFEGETLSQMQHVTRLLLSTCPGLSLVPVAPRLKDLCIIECAGITQIPFSPHLTKLAMERMPQLTHLPALSELRDLELCSCPEVAFVQHLPNLRQLAVLAYPQRVPTLRVSDLPQLTRLEVKNVDVLAVGDMPKLKRLQLYRVGEIHAGILPLLEHDLDAGATEAGAVLKRI